MSTTPAIRWTGMDEGVGSIDMVFSARAERRRVSVIRFVGSGATLCGCLPTTETS